MKSGVIIPVYNEENNITKVVESVKKYTPNIVVVDDGSTDNTAQKAEEAGATVLKHLVNLGKGAAARTGCDYAYQQKFEQIILLDGDGQHDPKEIPHFMKQLENNDIVFGYREFNKNMPLILRLGNQSINFITKLLYGMDLKDTQGGYRAFNTKVYKKIRWRAGDYSMESEMIANAGRNKLKYSQIPIQTIYCDKYKGTTILDGIKIVMKMLRWKLKC